MFASLEIEFGKYFNHRHVVWRVQYFAEKIGKVVSGVSDVEPVKFLPIFIVCTPEPNELWHGAKFGQSCVNVAL